MIEQGLYTVLTGDSGVVALCSTRVYPGVIPQDEDLPAIAYQLTTQDRPKAHSGGLGIVISELEVAAVAETYAAAKELGAAIVTAVERSRCVWGSTVVGKASAAATGEIYSPDTDSWTVTVNVRIEHKE
jgi:hypothetical protein